MTDQPFGDIPLFRELERLLSSSDGPINFEIARQVATAAATGGLTPTTPPTESTRVFTDVVHISEEYLGGYTRLQAPEPATAVVIDPGQWVKTTLESWRWLLEAVAQRFTSLMGSQAAELGSAQPQMAGMLGQIAPLLLGIQVGTMIGQLAGTAVGRYDLPIPREDDGALFFVEQNITTIAGEYGLETEELRRWLGLQHTSRHIVATAVPWFSRYLRSLLNELVDTIEIDMGDIERRIGELQAQGPEALQSEMGAADLLPIVDTERRRRANDRLLAFVALWEGYARHAAEEVGATIVKHGARISESMTRRSLDPNEGETMMAGVLGLSLDRALPASGQTFCAAIVSLKGLHALNRVWEAPDNLPTLEEIRDPFAWMDRVLVSVELEDPEDPD
jgi:putative hydrolase